MLLRESETRLLDVIREYFLTTPHPEWDSTVLVEAVLRESTLVDINNNKEKLTKATETVLRTLADTNTVGVQAKAAKWKKSMRNIMRSEVISKIFLHASCHMVKDVYAAATELAVVRDKRRTVESMDTAVQTPKRQRTLCSTASPEQRKHLQQSDLEGLTPTAVLERLAVQNGPHKTLDLTTTSVSKQFVPALKAACDQLPVKLEYVATETELCVLRRIAERYTMKRWECKAKLVEEMKMRGEFPKTEPKINVDAILEAVYGRIECLHEEDKPEGTSRQDIAKDASKLSKLRESIILAGVRGFREMKIAGTRYFAHTLVHYWKTIVTVPSTFGHYQDVAKVLLTLISLKRHIDLNQARFEAMLHSADLDRAMYMSRSPVHISCKEDYVEPESESEEEWVGKDYEENEEHEGQACGLVIVTC
ncbi:hypothetical protein EC973_003131 [Apophysomyces ossiformis]|uniref:Uncharacterized protein n=1 Tax=Apophysomyces ossiformis TaxID=679940 RepID=A0A8H7EM70_9FUNG|nr:hypothetical protein EC973_003131 [Apophysomyces ossiformis]